MKFDKLCKAKNTVNHQLQLCGACMLLVFSAIWLPDGAASEHENMRIPPASYSDSDGEISNMVPTKTEVVASF